MEKKPRYKWLQEVLPIYEAAQATCNILLFNPELLKRECYKENTIQDAFIFVDADDDIDWHEVHKTYFKPKDTAV